MQALSQLSYSPKQCVAVWTGRILRRPRQGVKLIFRIIWKFFIAITGTYRFCWVSSKSDAACAAATGIVVQRRAWEGLAKRGAFGRGLRRCYRDGGAAARMGRAWRNAARSDAACAAATGIVVHRMHPGPRSFVAAARAASGVRRWRPGAFPIPCFLSWKHRRAGPGPGADGSGSGRGRGFPWRPRPTPNWLAR
jgi:hypothetical protein